MNLRKIKRLKCLFKANKKYLMIKKKKIQKNQNQNKIK